MPGRVEMGGAMSGQAYPFEAPTFAARQVFFFQAGKKLENIRSSRLMIEILDFWTVAWRIGGHIVFERDRNVDDFARHERFSIDMAGLVPAIDVFDSLHH